MGTDIEVTPQEINMSLRGILTQLRTTDLDDGYYSFADAIEQNNMWDFLFLQAEVIACLHKFSVRDNKIIHDLTHRRS